MAKQTTPAPTEHAVRLPPHANADVHARIMADLQRMSPDEFKASLVKAGICTPDGQLTEHYAEVPTEADVET